MSSIPSAPSPSTSNGVSTHYCVVEYFDYRKEVYIAVRGVSSDKAKACSLAKQLCKQKCIQYAEDPSYFIVKNIHDAGFESRRREDDYVDVESRPEGTPIARYRGYGWVPLDADFILQEYYSKLQSDESKSVTLNDFVSILLESNNNTQTDYAVIGEKFDLTQVIGDNKHCSNTSLLVGVVDFVLRKGFAGFSLQRATGFNVLSSVVFAVFEVK
jgi:hypothetical protein